MSNLSPDQIDAALKAGIISQKQAQNMRQAAQSTGTSTPLPNDTDSALIGNEEDLRFIRGFSDIFIAIGILLVALGLIILVVTLGGGLSYLIAAAIMALMAEYFGRKKRAHLPTLIIALAFLGFAQQGLGVLMEGAGWAGPLTTAFITAVLMTLFYIRIRLPFCIALIALSLLSLFYALIFTAVPDLSRQNLGWFIGLGGLITLCAAIAYDMRDVHRTTRFSDNAFWLHLVAAPLIIHGLVIIFISRQAQTVLGLISIPSIEVADAFILLIIVAIISVIALALNRRALIVSSLGYALFALGFIISETGVSFGVTATISLLMLGLVIVLLGVGWHGARNQLLKVLPKFAIFPPPFDPSYTP